MVLPNFNNGFHQQNKSYKILTCLVEIVLIYSEFFASADHYRNVEDNFFKKNFFTPSRNSFPGYSFFHLTDIPACENSFSVKWKRFINELFIPASGNRKSFFLFRALLQLLKFGGGNSCFQKLTFWLVELIFSHFSDTPSSESYFPSSRNVFSN